MRQRRLPESSPPQQQHTCSASHPQGAPPPPTHTYIGIDEHVEVALPVAGLLVGEAEEGGGKGVEAGREHLERRTGTVCT
jgi:hypothetical protein